MKTENNNKSHEEIKKMAELYNLLVENSPDGIGIILDRKIAFLNEPGLRLFGYTKDEIIGKDVTELVHPEDVDKVLNHIETVLSEGCAQPIEYRLLTKNGEIIHVETARCKIEYEGKSAVQCIVRDIAERRKREKKIREMEERYRSLVENSYDGIGVSCEGKIVFANKKLAEMHGYTVEELIGKSPFDLIPPEDRERAIKNVSTIVTGGSLPSPREYKIFGRNGEIIEIEATSSRIEYEGKPAIQSTIRDISERKKRESDIKDYIRHLEILNKVAVDRELRMIELKKEANELLHELGRDKKYQITE